MDSLEENTLQRDTESDSTNGQLTTTLIYAHIPDRHVVVRALASLPAVLHRSRGVICTRQHLRSKTRFGPVQGVKRTVSRAEVEAMAEEARPLFLLRGTSPTTPTLLDVSDQDKSNWLSLLPLGDDRSANLCLYEQGGALYAMTARALPPRARLALAYSAGYARAHRLPTTLPTIQLESDNSIGELQCDNCAITLPTLKLLQRHIDLYHSELPRRGKKKYRCNKCSRVFSRPYCLKRHKLHKCDAQLPIEKRIVDQSPQKDNSRINSSSDNLDDIRLPLDESFQNILDFSSALFDPDRSLPNLDISSSSKSDVSLRSDNGMVAIDASSLVGRSSAAKAQVQIKMESPRVITCNHCNISVPENNIQKHNRTCRGRWRCECGLSMRSKEQLAEHIHEQHPRNDDIPQKQQAKPKGKIKIEKNETENLLLSVNQTYACDYCKFVFKRRGMLVNHLWRAHPERPNLAAARPVLRRVRHYLCSACPKLYRTAAKRDLHMRHHHPGSAVMPRALYCVEGGVSAAGAVQCALCPRQYATRAKMLQHLRSKHPQEAPPQKSQGDTAYVGEHYRRFTNSAIFIK